jgi:RHS repeat-associated protein
MLDVEKVMMYPNGYININQSGEYTKHYYAEEQRIASKIGTGLGMIGSDTISYFVPGNEWSIGYIVTVIVPKYSNTLTVSSNTDTTFNSVAKQELGLLIGDTIDIVNYSLAAIPSFAVDSTVYEDGLYFYHGNNLSSTQLITDITGSISQAILYTPFGQIISEYRYDWMLDTIPRYLFNAKELDEENGMYYYSARYYAPPVFTSRDPLFEKYFWMSPYAYCENNPVNMIDPTGLVAGNPSDRPFGRPSYDQPATSRPQVAPLDRRTFGQKFVDNYLPQNVGRTLNAVGNMLSGVAQCAGGVALGASSEGILASVAVGVCLDGGYKLSIGVQQLANVVSGTPASKDPQYSSIPGAATESKTLDNITNVATGIVTSTTGATSIDIINTASTIVAGNNLIKNSTTSTTTNNNSSNNSNSNNPKQSSFSILKIQTFESDNTRVNTNIDIIKDK